MPAIDRTIAHVHIGPNRYAIKLVDRVLHVASESCTCIVDHDKGEILLSRALPDRNHIGMIAQAVAESWQRYKNRSDRTPGDN